MNESENLWNADSLLKLSEDLQAENEQYRSLLAQKENQIQMHLSDVQKLKSQIRSMQSTIAEQGQEIQKLNAHIARLAESDLVLVENEKLKKENQQVLAEKEKAQRIFAEAEKKAENANVVLMKAKALEADFNKHISVEAKHICKQVKADMQMQLQEKLRTQTATLGVWTWVIAFISIVQTVYIFFVNKDVVATIPDWFLHRGRNVMNVSNLLCRVYQWCYEYLAQYVHSYVAVGIIALVSVGIAAGVFVLVKIAFDRITEKCDDRWQYYKNTGVAELRKAVSVALCVISVTLSMLSVSLIPVDINVLSWWLILSAGLNFLYHGSCKGSYH